MRPYLHWSCRFLARPQIYLVEARSGDRMSDYAISAMALRSARFPELLLKEAVDQITRELGG